MAAGEGMRLRPLTERWAKPVLPIDGRPVLATLLRELAAAGFEEVSVVTGHLAEQVESLVGGGTSFGLEIRFVRQPQPLGSADAIRRALRKGAKPPLLVTAADTVFVPGDIRAAAERWLYSGTVGGLGVRRGGRPNQTPVRVEANRIRELGAPSDHTAAPLWLLSQEITDRLDGVPGPPFEVASAVQDALAAGEEILALELGPTRDLTHPADLLANNFPYLLRWQQ